MKNKVYIVFDYNPHTGLDDVVVVFYTESDAKQYVEENRPTYAPNNMYYGEYEVE